MVEIDTGDCHQIFVCEYRLPYEPGREIWAMSDAEITDIEEEVRKELEGSRAMTISDVDVDSTMSGFRVIVRTREVRLSENNIHSLTDIIPSRVIEQLDEGSWNDYSTGNWFVTTEDDSDGSLYDGLAYA